MANKSRVRPFPEIVLDVTAELRRLHRYRLRKSAAGEKTGVVIARLQRAGVLPAAFTSLLRDIVAAKDASALKPSEAALAPHALTVLRMLPNVPS
jgi:hypothetical protein